MSVSLVVDGSPASCRAASKDIRALGERVGTATDMLARSMITACGAWSGNSSDAFTDFVKERINRADELNEELLLLASAMEGFGLVLADVKSEMKRARSIAAGHGIPVGASLPEVGEIELEPGQEGPLDHAVGVANRAREREASLQSAWQESLARVSKLVWDPADWNSVGKTATPSGPLDTLKDLAPDLSELTPSLPHVDLSGLLEHAKKVRPNPITIGGSEINISPTFAGGAPFVMLSAIKATKRAFPDGADEIDQGIRVVTKHGSPALGALACGLFKYTEKLVPLCEKVGEITSGPLADKVVEATDAK